MAPTEKKDITKDIVLFNAYKNVILQQQRDLYLDNKLDHEIDDDYNDIENKPYTDPTKEQKIEAVLKDQRENYIKRRLKTDDTILQFLADNAALKNETAIENLLKLKHNKTAIKNLASHDNAAMKDYYLYEDEFFNRNLVKNLYAPKTDVTKLEAYKSNIEIEGAKLNYSNDFFRPNFDKIQEVQIDVPESIDDKTATLITIGEYVNPKYKKNILKDFKKISNSKITLGDTTNYEMVIMEYALGDANYHRPNEYVMIQAGGPARANAKEIIENIDKDPAKAVKNIEAVIRTYMPMAYHTVTEVYTAPKTRVVTSAMEALKNPLFAKYVSLSETEKENAMALVGYSNAMQAFAKSEEVYKNAKFAAMLNENDKKLQDSPMYQEAYIDHAVNCYIYNYYSNVFTNGAEIQEHNKNHTNITAIGADPFSIAFGKDPNFVKQQVRRMLLKDETFQKELNEATALSGIDNFESIKVEKTGLRLLGNSPEKFRNSLSIINKEIQESFKKYNNKLFKDESYKPYVEALLNARKGWESFVESAQTKKEFTREDLKQAKHHLSEIIDKMEQPGFEKNRKFGFLKEPEIAFLDDLKNVAIKYEGCMADEIDTLRKHEPIVQTAAKVDNLKENIEYQQYKIRVKLDMAKSLLEPMNKLESPTKEQMDAFHKSFSKINKDISMALGEILVNKSVQVMLEKKGDAFSPGEIEKLTDPANIRKSARRQLETPEFKQILKTINVESIAAVSSDPNKKEFPIEGVEKLQEAYIAALRKPKAAVNQTKIVKQNDGLLKK